MPLTSNAREDRTIELADEMIGRLRTMGDPARARGVQQYFKREIVALGIDTPTLRLFIRERIRAFHKSAGLAEAIQLSDRLLREPELEIRGAAILALAAFKKEFSLSLLVPAKRWLNTRLDNWALVDSFCGCVLSPLFERYPTIKTQLRQWSGHPRLWTRRAALVTLVPFARRGRHLDLAYELAHHHFCDPEDLMHKATGWLLREAGKTDMARLRQFLHQHGPAVPRTALRYAIERFPDAVRQQLLELTRHSPISNAS
jgi:3-methyladenine DNA glycosylase AlkD